MARTASGDAALVEVKAVEPSWPAIGAATLAPPMPTAEALAEKDGVFGAAAEEALLARLDLKIGDAFRLGEATIRPARRPRRANRTGSRSASASGRALLISQAALKATGLVQPGSLVRWTTRVVMGGAGGPPGEAAVKALIAAANRAFPEAGWETRSRLNVSPDFTRDLDRFAEFLTLAGLLSLVVGGVGVANAAQGFVERKRATLAILKAIGATGTSVVQLAVVEFLAVALVGAARWRGARRAQSLSPSTPCSRTSLPIPLAPSVDRGVVALGLAYGLLTALVFAVPPLSPGARSAGHHADPRPRRGTPGLAEAALPHGRLARRRRARRARRGHQPAADDCLRGRRGDACRLRRAPAGGARPRDCGSRARPVTRPVELRMALAAIHRPGALTGSIVLSLGLGLAALVALSLIDFNMRDELHQTLPGETPSFFFLDLSSAEAPRFLDFLKAEAPGAKISETPMMRGRFVTLAGTPVEKVKASDKVAWALEGDRGVTFASNRARGVQGRRGVVVAARLCRAAARLDGGGGGEGARPQDRRSRGGQRARARCDGDGREFPQGELAQLRHKLRARLFAQHL